MKKKYRLLVFLAVSLLLLAGWGKKTVELLNSKKLIDLDAAIALCLPGVESEPDGEKPKTSVTPLPTVTPKLTVTPVPSATPRPTVTPKPTATPKPRVVVINVRNREVTCGSETWEDMDALKEQIISEAGGNVTFRLVDDFAEAHVYRRVMAILEELARELTISYVRD